jgi:site-specific recombinase XerD
MIARMSAGRNDDMLTTDSPNAELLRRWLLDLRRRNLRPRTVETYGERLDLLRRWAASRSLLALTTDDLELWLDSRGYSANTRKLTIAAMHSFYGWAVEHDLIDRDETRRLQRPVVRPGRPRPVADDDLSLALAEANEQTRVILLLGALAGLRASEMANLRAEDVDLTAGMLEVVDGKGGKARFVPVHDVLASALRALPLPTAGYVLVDANGRKLTRAQVLVRVRRVLDAPTHALRHTAGTMLWKTCHDLLTVAEILGHEDPKTTKVYARFQLDHASDVVASMKVPGAWN